MKTREVEVGLDENNIDRTSGAGDNDSLGIELPCTSCPLASLRTSSR